MRHRLSILPHTLDGHHKIAYSSLLTRQLPLLNQFCSTPGRRQSSGALQRQAGTTSPAS
jgi:hypothetical protein